MSAGFNVRIGTFNVENWNVSQAKASYGTFSQPSFFSKEQEVFLNRFKSQQDDWLLGRVTSFQSVYLGELDQEIPNGIGTKAYCLVSLSKIYRGQFKKGVPDGLGILWQKNNDWYEGEWEKGLKHGKGRYHFEDGSLFEGIFQRNSCDNGVLKTRQSLPEADDAEECLPCTIL